MKVQNMTSANGKAIPNQFIIDGIRGIEGSFVWRKTFQSYNSVIATKTQWEGEHGFRVELDRDKWDYSKTTGKYRNIFLGETKKETEAKIKSGEYELVNLN